MSKAATNERRCYISNVSSHWLRSSPTIDKKNWPWNSSIPSSCLYHDNIRCKNKRFCSPFKQFYTERVLDILHPISIGWWSVYLLIVIYCILFSLCISLFLFMPLFIMLTFLTVSLFSNQSKSKYWVHCNICLVCINLSCECIGHVTLADITGTTILVPNISVKSCGTQCLMSEKGH